MPRALQSDKPPYGPGVAFSPASIRLTCWTNQSLFPPSNVTRGYFLIDYTLAGFIDKLM